MDTMFVRKIVALFLAGLALSPLAAKAADPVALKAFPDFLSVRSEFLSALITAPIATASAFKPAYRDTSSGRLRISTERAGSNLYVLFLLERDGAYPYASRGNIIVKRDASTGYMSAIKWFLSDDGLSWISLTPKNERTILDYVVGGSVVRSGASLPTILYYFLMNSFGYLHNAAEPAIDWSLALGSPGPAVAEGFASALGQAKPSGPAKAFLAAVSDFTKVDAYMKEAGQAGDLPEEVTVPAWTVASQPVDERESAPAKAQPAYDPSKGLSLSLLSATILSSSRQGAAWIVFIDGGDGRSPLELAVVAFWDGRGAYRILAWDPNAKREMDWAQLVRSRPASFARLFRLPLPNS